MKKFAPFLFALLLAAPITVAQSLSALMNQAMDKQVKLDLAGPLPGAMDTIGKQTGVKIQADPSVWELLPWGEDTTLTAHIENQTLRQALGGITQRLGLTYELKDQSVQLLPAPPLRRIGRRATLQELQALTLLAQTSLQLQTDRPTIKQLVDAVDARLQAVDADAGKNNQKPMQLSIEVHGGNDPAVQDKAIFVDRNATLFDALESLGHNSRLTWYPWGKSILIVSKEDQVRNQLGKTVSVRYSGADISQVLTELSQAAGVDFSIQPGAIQQIPPEFRKVNLLLDNASVHQALESISGFTGLGYVVNEKGVYVWNQSADRPAVNGRDPIIGMIPLDNGMQLFVPQSSVPPDVRDYLKYKTKIEVDHLRKQMKKDGFTPATQPTTQRENDQ